MRFLELVATIGLTARALAEGLVLTSNGTKQSFINNLVDQMTLPELVLQLHMLFADNVVGPNSDNALYDQVLRLAPDAGIGVVHDWYPLNKSYVNGLQKLNLEKSRLKIPFIHFGECLHGVGSFKQSIFPQQLGMAASWDTDIVHRVGRAIGTEARAIGVHACFSPVLDVCQDPRWGRCQEDFGEDHILTAHMGVAYASGLSKNSTWGDQDAVAPVMKHFAAHGSPQSGLNGAPFMGHGNRQVLNTLLLPFKAVVDQGGVRGVMMAYNELDDVPSAVNPMLYNALRDWNFDGFTMADDVGMRQLQYGHNVADSPASVLMQWFNAGGMIQFYDYSLEKYLNVTIDLVANGSVAISTLQEKVRRILGVKYDLGLFENPYLAEDIDADQITSGHELLALEAAHKSIVLLDNRNSTLPLNLTRGSLKKLALIGPFSDILNFGDYSGQFGSYPVERASTIRQGVLNIFQRNNSSCELATAWGANSWLYNTQSPIASYHLSANGTRGGLLATYYADTNFSQPLVQKIESPVRDWGLYPPDGLPSNNFSVIWEGILDSPVDTEIDGFLGVGVGPNTTARLYVDGTLLATAPMTKNGNLQSNIPSRDFSLVNSTLAPPGSSEFTFVPGQTYKIRLDYQTWNLYQKIENQNSLNSQVVLFWNLVDRASPVAKAVSVSQDADVIVLALGANWNSDGENGDRGTLDLPANQTELANAIYALNKPVVLVLEGGRPFAIPDFYNRSAAVLNTYFGGQAGGQAIADVLFGEFSPGGRLPLTIPKHVGQLPVYYNYKATVHSASYVDISSMPMYPFGYGLSYTEFKVDSFAAATVAKQDHTFTNDDTVVFTARIENTGSFEGSYVAQVYLLQRVSQITQPVRQLVAFDRVFLRPGESQFVQMELDVNRYLRILNRGYEWELEKGGYTFALSEHGGMDSDTSMNVTMQCI